MPKARVPQQTERSSLQNSATPETAAPFRPTLDVRPDTIDFRDRMYEATLKEVPEQIPLKGSVRNRVPILDQGNAGACAGFALATVAHYLLQSRAAAAKIDQVSPWMFYEAAQLFDSHDQAEAFGRTDDPDVGVSIRSAMKGWHKYGICSLTNFPVSNGAWSEKVLSDASLRPLGAYFRVNHRDLVAMHTALAEVGILYAAACLHSGWTTVPKSGFIQQANDIIGGHAFAIVGFDRAGFWIQNSWGTKWGRDGFGHISYDDWLENGTDIWVARLGAPAELKNPASIAVANSSIAVQSSGYAVPDLADHIISLGNDGLLKTNGSWAKSEADVADLFTKSFVTATNGWQKRRLVLYVHGGLVGEQSAVDRISSFWTGMKPQEIYPVAFVWHTDYLSTLGDILQDAVHGIKPEGVLDATKDFLLDRLDDTLEPIARVGTGKIEWDQMQENGIGATTRDNGGARIVAQAIQTLLSEHQDVELHIIGHSAGSIFLAPLLQLLCSRGAIASGPLQGKNGMGITVESCTLWAPACTVRVFEEFYQPAIASAGIKRFALFTLDDKTEQDDDCAHIYHKSLLYLVSNAFEERTHIPLRQDGTPILGMAKFVQGALAAWLRANGADWILSPNQEQGGSPNASTARHHGDFNIDPATLAATTSRILGAQVKTAFSMTAIKADRAPMRRNAIDLALQ